MKVEGVGWLMLMQLRWVSIAYKRVVQKVAAVQVSLGIESTMELSPWRWYQWRGSREKSAVLCCFVVVVVVFLWLLLLLLLFSIDIVNVIVFVIIIDMTFWWLLLLLLLLSIDIVNVIVFVYYWYYCCCSSHYHNHSVHYFEDFGYCRKSSVRRVAGMTVSSTSLVCPLFLRGGSDFLWAHSMWGLLNLIVGSFLHLLRFPFFIGRWSQSSCKLNICAISTLFKVIAELFSRTMLLQCAIRDFALQRCRVCLSCYRLLAE